jgi:hypothetical protein
LQFSHLVYIVQFFLWTNYRVYNYGKNEIEAIKSIASIFEKNFVYVVFVLFTAYLFGSIIRSVSVRWAEYITFPFRSVFPKKAELKKSYNEIIKLETKEVKIEFESLFYPPASPKTDESKIESETDETNSILDKDKTIPGDIFNYWKDVLCVRNDKAFEYYQTFETQSRYSAGMVWASAFGVFISILRGLLYPPIHWGIVFISIGVYIVFSWHLRRVRKQESKVLMFLYIATLKSEK